MKRINLHYALVLSCTFFLSISHLNAQEKKSNSENLVVIDPYEPFSLKLEEIHKNHILNLQLKNVNPFLYKIDVKINQKDFRNTANSPLTTSSLSPTYNIPNIGKITSLAPDFSLSDNNDNGETDREKYNKENEKRSELNRRLNELNMALNNYDKVTELNSLNEDLNKINFITSDNKSQSLFDTRLTKEELIEEKSKLNQDDVRYEAIDIAINNYHKKKLYEALENELKSIVFEWKNNDFKDLTSKDISKINLKKEISDIRGSIGDINKNIETLNAKAFVNIKFQDYEYAYSKIHELNGIYRNLKKVAYTSLTHEDFVKKISKLRNNHNISSIDNLRSHITGTKQELDDIFLEIYANINDSSSKEKIKNFHSKIDMNAVENLIDHIIDINSFKTDKYWNPRLSFGNFHHKTDDLHFEVKLIPNQTPNPIKMAEKEYNFSVPIKGGLKFDISLGVSFLTGLNDVEFERIKKTDSTSVLIPNGNMFNNDPFRRTKFSGFTPYATTFLNVYLRSKSNFKPTFNIGLGTNIDDVSYLVGLGLIIGRQERIVIHAGLAYRKTSDFNSQYQRLLENDNDSETSGLLVNKPIEEFTNDDITIEKYNQGFYFGFSYNLSSNKEKEFQKFAPGKQ